MITAWVRDTWGSVQGPRRNSAVHELWQPLIDAPKPSAQNIGFLRLPLLS